MFNMLIAEHEISVSTQLCEWFSQEHYFVEILQDTNSARRRLRERKYDVVMLSTSLPEAGGMSVCREYRAWGGTAVVIMLSDTHSDAEMDAVIDGGADDFESKPLNMRNLSARVRALSRRQMVASKLLFLEGLVLDPLAATVLRDGREIHLHPKEFKLLELLLRYPNQIFSNDALVERVWKWGVREDTVRTHIKTLRKKIDAPGLPSVITTVRGQGYKIATP